MCTLGFYMQLVDRKTALEKEKAEMEVDAEQVLLAQEQAKVNSITSKMIYYVIFPNIMI